ncbi:MAG TPA: pseudouridine synthase [Candidatus Methylacidiphilales bacterium]
MASFIHKATAAEATTLLPFLISAWPGHVNRTQAKRWLHHKAVLVNGKATGQFDLAVKPGDVVAIRAGKFAAPGSKMTSGLKIVHEDTSILVVEKPSGLLTVATDKGERETAYYKATYYLRNRGQNERVFIVHRLDRDTSGLLVFAKTPKAKAFLQSNWDHAVSKRYVALVEGAPQPPQGTLRDHLDESRPEKVLVVAEEDETIPTRLAVTHYKTLKAGPVYTLIDVRIDTGRRNQIRVQFAAQGRPVAGDVKYGARGNPVHRLALHASELGFPHPVTNKPLLFACPAPQPFASAVASAQPLPALPLNRVRKNAEIVDYDDRDDRDDEDGNEEREFSPRRPAPRSGDKRAPRPEARREPARPGRDAGRTPRRNPAPSPRSGSRGGKPPRPSRDR